MGKGLQPLIVVLGATTLSHGIFTCSECPLADPGEIVRDADLIVVGTVVAAEDPGPEVGDLESRGTEAVSTIHLVVTQTLLGEPVGRIEFVRMVPRMELMRPIGCGCLFVVEPGDTILAAVEKRGNRWVADENGGFGRVVASDHAGFKKWHRKIRRKSRRYGARAS